MQGYDFYHLWKEHGVKVQMGGSDQWGNIVTGTELIRRKGSGQAFAITAPLITKADGSKFGKSEGGNVWLDKNRTSAYKFYQYWINAADEDAARYLRIFTLMSREEIEAIEAAHAENPGMRAMQKALAEDVTRRIHGQADLDTAIAASALLFGKSSEADLRALPEAELLSVFEGVPQRTVSRADLEAGMGIIDLLARGDDAFLASNGEARRALKEGSVSVNKAKVNDSRVVTTDDVFGSGIILLQRGKKNFFLVRVSDDGVPRLRSKASAKQHANSLPSTRYRNTTSKTETTNPMVALPRSEKTMVQTLRPSGWLRPTGGEATSRPASMPRNTHVVLIGILAPMPSMSNLNSSNTGRRRVNERGGTNVLRVGLDPTISRFSPLR